MKRVLIFSIFFCTISLGDVQAEMFLPSSEYSLGLNYVAIEEQNFLQERSLPFPGDFEESIHVEDVGTNRRGEFRGAISDVTLTAKNHDLGLLVSLKVTDPSEDDKTQLRFVWRMTDQIQLVRLRPGASLPGLDLFGNFVFDATVNSNHTNMTGSGEDGVFVDFFAGLEAKSTKIYGLDSINGFENINTAIGVRLGAASDQTIDYTIELRTVFDITGSYDFLFNGLNTLSFESLVFEDGSTPEDHGFAVMFASGRTSPNATSEMNPVPEPSTFALFGFTMLRMGAMKRHFSKTSHSKLA